MMFSRRTACRCWPDLGQNHFVRFCTDFGAEMGENLQNTLHTKIIKITIFSDLLNNSRVFTHSLGQFCRLSGIHNHSRVQPSGYTLRTPKGPSLIQQRAFFWAHAPDGTSRDVSFGETRPVKKWHPLSSW